MTQITGVVILQVVWSFIVICHPSIHPSVHPSIHSPIHPSTHPPMSLGKQSQERCPDLPLCLCQLLWRGLSKPVDTLNVSSVSQDTRDRRPTSGALLVTEAPKRVFLFFQPSPLLIVHPGFISIVVCATCSIFSAFSECIFLCCASVL